MELDRLLLNLSLVDPPLDSGKGIDGECGNTRNVESNLFVDDPGRSVAPCLPGLLSFQVFFAGISSWIMYALRMRLPYGCHRLLPGICSKSIFVYAGDSRIGGTNAHTSSISFFGYDLLISVTGCARMPYSS